MLKFNDIILDRKRLVGKRKGSARKMSSKIFLVLESNID